MSCCCTFSRLAFGLLFALSVGVVAVARADEHSYREHEFREHEFHEHQFLDARYHHDHYYPPRGYVFGALPPGPRVVVHGGVQFYFAAGVWYRAEGPARFVVVAPPFGLVVPVLPPFYTSVWVGAVPYYCQRRLLRTRPSGLCGRPTPAAQRRGRAAASRQRRTGAAAGPAVHLPSPRPERAATGDRSLRVPSLGREPDRVRSYPLTRRASDIEVRGLSTGDDGVPRRSRVHGEVSKLGWPPEHPAGPRRPGFY